MDRMISKTIHGRRLLVAFACALALPWVVQASGARAQTAGSTVPLDDGVAALDAASLVQCQTATDQAERSATFAGEMTMIPGATRMSMRIELLERMPEEQSYHAVQAPGLGVWRAADPGVKSYKHLEQVTNLDAPAVYRALVSFRWQGPHGRVLRHDEQRTPRCVQPAPVTPSPSPPLE
jgi:hypothetical protein